MDFIKKQSDAAILKYLIKRYKLACPIVLDEEDSEDVRFNYEITLDAMKKGGKLSHFPSSLLDEGNIRNVNVENEMSVVCALRLMSYDGMITTGVFFQNGLPLLPHHYAVKTKLTFLDFFIFIYSLKTIFNGNDESLLRMLFVKKHKGNTFFSKLAIKTYFKFSKPKERIFLAQFWDITIEWLRKD